MSIIPPVSEDRINGTAFDLSGPKDAPLVVLIHGLGLSRRLWDQHMSAFADFRVLRYDLYGHGASDPAPRSADLSLFSEQLFELMAALDLPKGHIVGFSIGGMINRRFALDHPKKTASLVIMNSPHDRGEEAQAAVEARARSVREQGAFSTFDAALQRWFTPAHLANGQSAAKVRDWRGQVDAESYAQTAWVLANGVRELIAPTPPISTKSLVITCENDSGSTPSMARAIGAEIAGSETLIIPHLQHLGLMEDPDAFTKPILDFLSRSQP